MVMPVIKDVITQEVKGLWGTDFSDKENGIPVIKTNNLSYEGVIDFKSVCYRNIEKSKAVKSYLKNGDLLIEKSGGTRTHSVGYVNFFSKNDDCYVCNNFILALRPDTSKIVPKYLFYQIRRLYEVGAFSDCFNKTTGIQNLIKDKYLSKEIKQPNLLCQNSIVNLLDTVQQAINAKKGELSALNELIKSRFIEMFGDPITNDKKFPFKRVIDVVKLQRGHDLPTQKRADNGEIPVWGSNGIVGFHNEAKIDGGVITGRSGTLGKVYYYDHPFWPLNTTLYSVDIHNNDIIYLKYLLEFYDLQRFSSGAGVPTLNRNEFHNEMIIDAPISLQNEFADFVKLIDKSKFIVQKQIDDLQELLDSKMDEYFG